MITDRQQRVLGIVVASYLESGAPIGSRTIAHREDISWAPSTVRAELAALESAGFLSHPHTSAGRMPTDSGYRFYVDSLLESKAMPKATGAGIEISRMRREVDEAIRETTAGLSRINDLLALVTAPPMHSASVHRVEVLLLSPRVVAVVVIASNGDVAKRTFTFERSLDPGLVEWASTYLNERLAGMDVGSRMLRARLDDPELSETERSFLGQIEPALARLVDGDGNDLYVDGTSRLLSEEHAADIPRAEELVRALERRVTVLEMLRSALDERSVFSWIGAENPHPALRSVSVVGANYGLGHRNLGSVGVVGPLRMDYATAIASVRDAAGELSRFFETVYDE